MSTRLEALKNTLKGFDSFIDVGTDHAYLPILALNENPRMYVIASDNKQGPLEIAKKHLQEAGLSDQVSLRLGHGLEVLNEPIDVVVCAGLGGKTIEKIILDKPDLTTKRIVAQPTQTPRAVRQLTTQLPFQIVDEIFAEEGDMPYTLIILEPGLVKYTEKELLYGPVLLKKRPPLYKAVLEKEYQFTQSLVDQIPQGNRKQHFINQARLLREVLDDWS
jgi:tRNA (adenine22-N1)-methyltransferase